MTIIIAVNHGECERILCSYLSRWLRLEIIPVERNRGSETISMKDTGTFMENGIFSNLKTLNRYYRSVKKGRSSRMLGISDVDIFVIMDVDGDVMSRKAFSSKDLFRKSVFYDRITPVVNNPNMDVIFRKAGFDIPSGHKPEAYNDALDSVSVDELCRRLEGLDTDIPMMIRMLMKHSPSFQK